MENNIKRINFRNYEKKIEPEILIFGFNSKHYIYKYFFSNERCTFNYSNI